MSYRFCYQLCWDACVVKSPTDKQLPQKVNSELELENALDQMKKVNDDVLIEEFIDGVECTVPVVSNYIETKALLLSYYNKADRCTHLVFKTQNNIRVNSDTENILKMAEDIVKNTGVKVMQVRLYNKGKQILCIGMQFGNGNGCTP